MRFLVLISIVFSSLIFSACGSAGTNSNSETAKPSPLVRVERPQKIVDMMAQRGEQDNASPVLKVLSPAEGSTVNGSTVKVKLGISGDLKGYKPGMNEETHTGNHIHVILDNQPYEAYYNLDNEFELRNVADGPHTLRVFPSRPWHESYKNQGAFQIVKFTVADGGADTTQPTTTATGETMANANTTQATPEGKEMKESKAGEVDTAKPLLTFSRPKGEYKGADAAEIMVDFWLSNAKLKGDGGEYSVRWTVNDQPPQTIEKWEPIWISRWTAGKNTIKLELLDADGNVVENGGYNTTEREITVTY